MELLSRNGVMAFANISRIHKATKLKSLPSSFADLGVVIVLVSITEINFNNLCLELILHLFQGLGEF